MFLPTAPILMVHLYPPLITGDSGGDAIELLCTVSVTENLSLDLYQFEWSKDDTPIDLFYYHTVMVCYQWTLFGTKIYL